MADNQFIIRKGLIALDDSQITGSLSVTNSVTASFFTGSYRGDGSQLTGIEGFPFTGSAGITGSLTVVGPVNATTFTGDGSQLTGIEGFPFTGSAKITGSLEVTGSVTATSFTGSLQGTATSASYVQLANVDGFVAYSASVSTAIDSVLDATTPITATINNTNSPFTITSQSIVIIDSTNGDVTVNLPDLNAINGTPDQKPILLYKNDYSQNVIYVQPSGSQLVNGTTQDIIVSIQIAIAYNPTSAGWVTEGTSYQSLAELEMFFVPRTETGSFATTGSNQFSGSQAITGSLTVTGGIVGTTSTASYVEYANVANKPALVSGSSQISFNGITDKPTLVSGSSQITYSGLTGIPSDIVSSSAQVAGYGVFATTGSNTFQANQVITGSLFITQNLVVAGSSSIQYISSSVLDIADNIITVNAFNPGVRFGGLAVIDSGSSPQVSGSMLFDSIRDQWIFVHQNQAVVTSSVLLMGPETYNDLGNETYLSANRLPKGSGVEHLRDSNITDTGTVVSINSNTQVTGSFTVVTGSAVELQVTNTGVNIGNSTADNHNVTGSLRASGSLAVTGAGTFSSSVTATTNSSGRSGFFGGTSFGLRIDNSGSFNNGGTTLHGVDNTFVASYQKLSLNGSSLEFMTDYGTKLTIANNGTSTFSSNVIATGGTEIPNGQFYRARRSSSNLLIDLLGIESGTDNTRLLITGDFNIKNGSLVTLLNMTTTGAATFSSSITSFAASSLVASVTSNPSNDAVVAARWTSGVGMEMRYNPDFALGYIQNTYQVTSGQPYGDIYFRQNVGGTMTTRMTIKADGGRIGIGTTTPDRPFELYNAATIGLAMFRAANENGAAISIKNDQGTNDLSIYSAGSTAFGISGWANNGIIESATGITYSAYNGNHIFQSGVSGRTERMRITSGGSVLIGTATSSGDILTIAGSVTLTSGANRQIYIGSASNYYYRIRTDGDDFVISEAAVSDRLRYSYGNTRWEITGGLAISGALSKGSGSFKIDHPLPSKKNTHHLVHSFIEGPQADNIYRGKIQLVNGKATINLDQAARMTEGTFVLLNGNIQCFTSNESGWTAVKGIVEENILTIEAQDANCVDTVSWLVVGERIDQHMLDTEWTDENGKVITEPLKQ